MSRRETFATWAGVGAALLLAATAARFAAAADPPPPPPPPGEHGPWHGPEHGPGMMPGLGEAMMIEHLSEKLGLTPAQRDAVHKAVDEARPGFESLHKQMRKDVEKLARTRPDDPGYQALVASASQSASQTAGQIVLQASQLRSRVFGVLTPEQRDQVAKLQAEHQARMKDGKHGEHGWHRGHPGPDDGTPPTPPATPATPR